MHRTGLREEGDDDPSTRLSITTNDTITSTYHEQQEFSGRYAIYEPSFYVPAPEDLRVQTGLKQDSGHWLKEEDRKEIIKRMGAEQKNLIDNYEYYLSKGLSREQARLNLPFGLYVEFWWKQNLWNMLHFLELRRHIDAQKEIRAYAETIEQVIKKHFPFTYEAWIDKIEGAHILKSELEEVRGAMDGQIISEKLAKKLKVIK